MRDSAKFPLTHVIHSYGSRFLTRQALNSFDGNYPWEFPFLLGLNCTIIGVYLKDNIEQVYSIGQG